LHIWWIPLIIPFYIFDFRKEHYNLKNKISSPIFAERINHIITICLFCLILGGISIGSILKKDSHFSETENRILKQKPELSLENIKSGKYEKEYEEYLSDQFLFRNQWIACKTKIDRLLLKQEVNGVYFSKNDYYIEKHEKEEFQNKISQKNITYMKQFITQYQDILGKENIQVLIVPTASYILKEKLPAFALEDGQKEFLEEIKKEIPEENYISVEEILLEHKTEDIYYRTDHHWTTLGAYYGYLAWAEQRNITAWTEDKFHKKIVSDNFLGTIQSKVNIKMPPDNIILYEPLSPISYEMRINLEETIQNSIYDLEKLKTKDQYAVFLGGNSALTEIKSDNRNGKKLLLIKDSFANSISPFMINHFEETYLLDFRYFNGSLEQFITENGITEICILYSTVNLGNDRYFSKLLR
jgi:hypothetical protein